jgi:hypothetical protein
MSTITFEIENPTDMQLMVALAARLGITIKKNGNGKQLSTKNEATEYLFSTEANKNHLEKAIEYVENGGELIEVELDTLKKQYTL